VKKIICYGERGGSIEFCYRGYPICLVDTDGFSAADYAVTTTKNNNQDGEAYNGATANKRNIVITAELIEDFAAQRGRLFSFFQPRSLGTVHYIDGGTMRKADYYVERVLVEESGVTRPVTISLICPDPKFYDDNATTIKLSSRRGFTFPLRLKNPFIVTQNRPQLIGEINNVGNVSSGVTIRFIAIGNVSSPYMVNMTHGERLTVNTTMLTGDIITVTTDQNSRKVMLTRNRITTNITNKLVYPPAWPQVHPGTNAFRLGAAADVSNLKATVTYTQAYWGV